MKRSRASADEGAVALIVAIMIVPVLLGSAALGVDVANWYAVAHKIQKAADAAALGGVVFMPASLGRASSTATDLATRNGFGPSQTTTVAVEPGSRPSQLKVTITTAVSNAFGGIIGSPTQALTRTAVADYAGPVPMGSPCNIFGNEPDPDPSDPGAAASGNCGSAGRNPQMWASIAGPGNLKVDGDRYANRVCSGGETGCDGRANTEFKPEGYFYKVSVAGPVSAISFEVFDPTFAVVSEDCAANLPASWSTDTPNDHVTDARARYARGQDVQFCTGDAATGGSAADAADSVTSFTVRDPGRTSDPLSAPVHWGCTKQFGGVNSDLQATLTNGAAGPVPYDDEIAKGFRQWVALCTIYNPTVGDYYVQARTNVARSATPDAVMAGGDNLAMRWLGQNYYSLRAKVTGDATRVSISGADRMSIFANLTGATTRFHLARIGSGSAGQTLTVSLFDAGDASNAGTVTVFAPGDGDMPALSSLLGCKDADSGSDLPGCAKPVSYSANNGKLLRISVPVPVDYRCDDTDPTACWFRIGFKYPFGTQVRDTTTWSMKLDGDPVRLVQ